MNTFSSKAWKVLYGLFYQMPYENQHISNKSDFLALKDISEPLREDNIYYKAE